jgi:hypothetical protein
MVQQTLVGTIQDRYTDSWRSNGDSVSSCWAVFFVVDSAKACIFIQSVRKYTGKTRE